MLETIAPNDKETPMEVIREKLRYTSIEERKYHRTAALNKNRSTLGEIQDKKRSWDTNFVTAKAKALKKKPLSIDDYLALQSALIQDEENINSFLKVDHVLVGLVRDLCSNNPAVQLVAANCCCNIALANAKACATLAKTAGPYLVAELDTINYPLVEVCAWTIGNMCSGSKAAFQALYDQGCLKRLQSLLMDCEPSILPSLIYSIKHCVHGGSDKILDPEYVNLAQAAIRQDCQKHLDGLWLLALLSSRNVCANTLLPILPAIFDDLCTSLDSESLNIEQVTATVRILGNVVTEPTESAADSIFCYPNEKLVAIFDKLLFYPHIHLRNETLWLIGNLYCHEIPRIRERMREIVSLLSYLKKAVGSS